MKNKKLCIGALVSVVITIVLYFAKNMLATVSQGGLNVNSPIVFYVGLVFTILGVVYTFMERKMGLPFFYGRSQSGGSNANSYVVLGIGLALVAKTTVTAMVLAILGAVLATAIRYFIANKNR